MKPNEEQQRQQRAFQDTIGAELSAIQQKLDAIEAKLDSILKQQPQLKAA